MSITVNKLDAACNHSVKISDGTNELSIDGSGFITANINGTVTVDATDLDIRDLVHTQDSVDLGDGTSTWNLQTLDSAFNDTGVSVGIAGVRQDAAGSPVSADGDAHPLVFNNDGELKVAADLTSSVADDAADSGNPIKVGGRGVDGALTALSASNDRFDLLGDLYRRVYVNASPNVGTSHEAASVTTTAAEVLGTPLGGRTHVTVQNLGDAAVYIGNSSGVTSANGIQIPPCSSATFEWGEDLDMFLIAASGTQDVRLLERG